MNLLTKLSAGLLLTTACAPATPPASDWDLVVVVLDALPAGHVGLYGYRPASNPTTPISPHIDAFAAGFAGHEALVFDNAYSTASYTLASTASLFTGTSPATHGVLGQSSNVLSLEHLTLAEALSDAGFVTAALSSNPNVSSEGHFDQGFGTFRHYFRDKFERHSLPATMLPDAGAWWQHHADERRFLYAHLLPPHQPYDPPPPHADLFGADSVPRIEGLTPYLVERGERRDLTTLSPEVQRIQRRYDAGVHYADSLFGELLARLSGEDGHGLDHTLVVLISDHGEAFAEHGVILHGTGVTEELCHVPLVMAFPEGGLVGGARRFAPVVSTGNLAPTLCQLFDVAFPGEAKGASFLDAALGDEPVGVPAVSRSAGETPLWSLRTDALTLIEHRTFGVKTLFDRTRDPKELVDLAASEPERLAELSAELSSQLKTARQAASAYPRASVPKLIHKDALEELGYFGDD
jgi:arylsulfatase A-like enzyme